MTLQQQVQQHLANTGISLRELAKQAVLGKSTVALVVSGRSNPSIATRRKLQAAIRDYKPQALDATVEQLAAQCIDSDLTHVRDTDLECAKYRRVMRLEQQLNDAQDKLEYMKRLAGEDGRKLQDYQAQIGKAEAMILGLNESNECLQKQLDHGQAAYSKLCSQLGATRTKYETQLEAANQKEAQLQEQLTEVYAEKTRQEAQVMRLHMYVWSLIAALVFVLVSGLVVWGGV